MRRIVYLGGLVPRDARRLARTSRAGSRSSGSCSTRARLDRAARLDRDRRRSRSFRFLVRLIERLPLLALPPWRAHRTQPIDERDVIEVARARRDRAGGGRPLARRRRPRRRQLRRADRAHPRPPAAAAARSCGSARRRPRRHERVAAAIAGERPELVGPLMAGLASDLLPRDDAAAALLGVRLHSLDAAIEHALGEWERGEPLAAR